MGAYFRQPSNSGIILESLEMNGKISRQSFEKNYFLSILERFTYVTKKFVVLSQRLPCTEVLDARR